MRSAVNRQPSGGAPPSKPSQTASCPPLFSFCHGSVSDLPRIRGHVLFLTWLGHTVDLGSPGRLFLQNKTETLHNEAGFMFILEGVSTEMFHNQAKHCIRVWFPRSFVFAKQYRNAS